MSDECRSLLSLDSQEHWRDGCLVSLEIAKKVFLFYIFDALKLTLPVSTLQV